MSLDEASVLINPSPCQKPSVADRLYHKCIKLPAVRSKMCVYIDRTKNSNSNCLFYVVIVKL